MNNWIRCKDRYPSMEERKRSEEFIVTIEGAKRSTTLCILTDNRWIDEEGNIYKVTAWMNMPNAFQEEKEKEE